MSSTVLLADEHVPADGDPAGLDPARVSPVAVEERLLADHRVRADGEQVGAHRHVPGEDHRPAPDLGAQRPQIPRVQRRAGGHQRQGVRLDQRLDDPEAEVPKAPDADLLRLPPADEHPFGHDRKGAQDDEGGAAEDHRPQVDLRVALGSRYPLVRPGADQRDRPGVHEEGQQLQRPAHEVLPGAGRRRRRRPGQDRIPRLDQGGYRVQVHLGLGLGYPERLRQAPDRRIRVDVLHGHHGQALALPHPRAEFGHDQRVRAQVVEENDCRRVPARSSSRRPASRRELPRSWSPAPRSGSRPYFPSRPPGSEGGLVNGLDRNVEIAAQHVLAVDGFDPVGLINGVEVALAQIGRDGHRGEVAGVVP